MLRYAKALRGYKLGAGDEEIGKVIDLYFDDLTWAVRYFVVRTGGWFEDRRVLVAPGRIGPVGEDDEILKTTLTRAEVEASPPAESERPLSECMEVVFYPYHFWPPDYESRECDPSTQAHLRSMEEVEGYTVAAKDGDIGHVEGFIVDDTNWVVRYLAVDTRNYWPGKHVLVSPEWTREVNYNSGQVIVDLERDVIKESPEVDLDEPISREYETDLCRFYGREGYWSREGCLDEESRPESSPTEPLK